MTIAIGLCVNDGVVLAADSQETVTGYIKGETGKIRTTIFSNRNVYAIVGSGDSDYIAAAKDKALEGIDELNDFIEVQKKIEENLLKFFDTYLARLPQSERPAVDLLIGISMRPSPFALFHYTGTVFHRVSQKAIGSGILLANGLLADLAVGVTTLHQSASIAVYIVSKVKSRVDGCGGFTDVVALRRNGDFAFTEIKQIRNLEDQFEAVERKMLDSLKAEISKKSIEFSWLSKYRNKTPTTPRSSE